MIIQILFIPLSRSLSYASLNGYGFGSIIPTRDLSLFFSFGCSVSEYNVWMISFLCLVNNAGLRKSSLPAFVLISFEPFKHGSTGNVQISSDESELAYQKVNKSLQR